MPHDVTPLILSMILCKDVVENPSSESVDIIGSFRSLRIDEFPHRHPLIRVYVELGDAAGTWAARLVCVRTRDDTPVFASGVHQLRFRSKLQAEQAVFTIRDCPFPEPGEYSIQLWVEQQFCMERRFQVTQTMGGDS